MVFLVSGDGVRGHPRWRQAPGPCIFPAAQHTSNDRNPMPDFGFILWHAHSGLRYLVLLAGLASFLYSIVAAVGNRPWDRPGKILLTSFVGILDLQVLIGLILVFIWPFYPALWGHIVMMVLAAGAAHFTSVLNRKRPAERKSHMTAALGVAGAMVLVVGGIAAIGRSIL
jgi:hypothetical protein